MYIHAKPADAAWWRVRAGGFTPARMGLGMRGDVVMGKVKNPREPEAVDPLAGQQMADDGGLEEAESFANIQPDGATSFANIEPGSE